MKLAIFITYFVLKRISNSESLRIICLDLFSDGAVIAVKEGDLKSAEAQLKSATSKNPELAKKAASDVNLKALRK